MNKSTSVVSADVDPDDGLEDEGPLFAFLPPDDRLWRHPSEMRAADLDPAASGAGGGAKRESHAAATAGFFNRRPAGGTRTWTVALVAGVVGALMASGVGLASGTFEHRTTVVQTVAHYTPPSTLAITSQGSLDWSPVASAMAPSLVGLQIANPAGPVSGAGVLYSGDNGRSYILTDESLLAGGGTITVQFANGTPAVGHRLGFDPVTDIAVVWVSGDDQMYPNFGSVADLTSTEPVAALGARPAAGQTYLGTVRSLDEEVPTTQGGMVEGVITFTADALPDSQTGGAIVDRSGKVVGISVDLSPSDPDDQGLSFAMPIDAAEHVASQLLQRQTVTDPWIGIADAGDISSVTAAQLGIPGGIQVGSVTPGSPAARLGVAPNDIITYFDNQQVSTTGSLTQLVDTCSPGHTAPISYLHKGKLVTQQITIANLKSTVTSSATGS